MADDDLHPSDYGFYEEECDHDDFEVDVLTGRATCNMCDFRWFLTGREFARWQKRMARNG